MEAFAKVNVSFLVYGPKLEFGDGQDYSLIGLRT
jgi:hypothetical protein